MRDNRICTLLMSKKKLVIFSGAGISAESGIPTFRDSDGLWEQHKVEDVATPEGWSRNRELVLEFYNERRRKLKEVSPNAGHTIIADMEKDYDVTVITQNIDNLHERAGSTNVVHLHGQLLRSRSTMDPSLIFECLGDIKIGDKCPKGSQLRPDVVWFGEPVPMMDYAQSVVEEADILVVVGTSLAVWPAAGLPHLTKEDCQIYYVDPKAEGLLSRDVFVLKQKASTGMKSVVEFLRAGGKPKPTFTVSAVLDVPGFGKYIAAVQQDRLEIKVGERSTLGGVALSGRFDVEKYPTVIFHLKDPADAKKFKKGDVVHLE